MNEDKKKKILKALYALERKGIKPGLERTLKLLDAFGNPHKNLKAIHVAGTNGKGTVCSLIASVLAEGGYKTGLYTSPHIRNFNERIRINGQMISDEEIIRYSEMLLPEAAKFDCTFFEITTVMAFLFFAENKTDIIIAETGMGGRFDSTNVLCPLVTVITSIDIDHTIYLGNTLDEIAFEKAGIIKKDIPLLSAVLQPDIRDMLMRTADERKSNVIFVNDEPVNNVAYNRNLSITLKCEIKNTESIIRAPLAGRHQLLNILLALKAIEQLEDKFPLSNDSIILGIKNLKENTAFTSRIEIIQKEPPIIIDVSHNPAALQRLFDTLSLHGYINRFLILFALMSDKDADSAMKILKPFCSELVLTKPSTGRAFKTEVLATFARKAGIETVKEIENPKEAFKYLKKKSEAAIITGSFYLIGDLYEEMERMREMNNC